MKRLILCAITLLMLVHVDAIAQRSKKKKKHKKEIENVDRKPFKSPKLVVGIVIDQMRYDYITRFWNDYGTGGIKRLVNEGYNLKNGHYNYKPTYTGPGHASIYTGTTPSSHGIIGNNWFDKETNKEVYCAQDDNQNSVGTTSDAGKMSPHRMKTTSITDQLR